MAVDDRPLSLAQAPEYANLYAYFAELIRERQVDVEVAPLQLVADAFLCGRRVEGEAFTG